MSTSRSNLVLYICATNIQWSCWRRSSYSSQGVSYGLHWHETEWSWQRIGQVESFPFLFKKGSKGMTFLYSPTFHWNMECHEEYLSWEVFPSISSCQHKEINIWDSKISWQNTLPVLGKIWATVHSMPSSSNTRSAAHSIFLWRIDAYWL